MRYISILYRVRTYLSTYFFFCTAMCDEFVACGYVNTVHVAVTYWGCRACKEYLQKKSEEEEDEVEVESKRGKKEGMGRAIGEGGREELDTSRTIKG